MDRAEAVKILEIQLDVTEVNTPSCIKLHEALDLAIEALGQPMVVYCRNCKHSTDTGDYQDTYFCDNPHHDSNHLVHSLEYCSHGKPKEKHQLSGETSTNTSTNEGDAESATTTDCISRQAAIEAVRGCKFHAIKGSLQTAPWYEAINEVLEILSALPPVTPTEQQEHGRLIDADELKRRIINSGIFMTGTEYTRLHGVIYGMPTIVPATPTERTGEWIEHDPKTKRLAKIYECPFCGDEVIGEKTNFCPNCGAKMNKGGDTE